MHVYGIANLKNYEDGNSRKWVLGNGLGGYASQSIINSQYRKHDGYLIASLKSPVERYMILNTITEEIVTDKVYDLTNAHLGNHLVDNTKHLVSFKLDTVPVYSYHVDGIRFTKTISLEYLKNTVAIKYHFEPLKDAKVLLTPHFNYREHGAGSIPSDFIYRLKYQDNFVLLNKKGQKQIKFYYSSGNIIKNNNNVFGPVHLLYDEKTGDTMTDYHYTPVKLEIELKEGVAFDLEIVTSIEKNVNTNATEIINNNIKRLQNLVKKANLKDEFANRLVLNSDVFVSKRKSTGLKTILAGLPWFTDWGRDTMIAYTGLLITTKRFKDAKEVLLSFAKYEKEGLIPNMFPDDNAEPLYNTVDASMWYFYAAYKYYEATDDLETIKELMPTFKNIIDFYQKGTHFDIKMNEDGLISAGSGFNQITWMDVFANGKVITPRHGKPVEINALWYNALKTYEYFADKLDIECDLTDLINLVKDSFNKRYYNEKTKCLYDVLDELETGLDDASIRPNQLFMFSLPYIVLDENRRKDVVDTCYKLLYNVYGMRSLAQSDPKYIGIYDGPLHERDEAYHMGTTWGFILGAFFDAYNHVYHDKNKLKEMFDNIIPHLHEGCLDGIAEVFNGDYPVHTRGCYTQAWSVAEVLRSYVDNCLK